MKTADLPTKKAQKPKEEAKIPFIRPASNKHLSRASKEKKKTSNEINNNENLSQNSYNEMLSQPASQMTHRERLLWLQRRRTEGLWVQCDDCDRWRYLPHIQDRHYLPDKWYCQLNPDVSMAKCSAPEAPLKVHDEEDQIHSEYSAGSLVWAKIDGYPWWPAMVDDCPDTEQYYWVDGFSDIPTYYHVAFFDSREVTRAWLPTKQLIPYHNNKNKIRSLLADNKKFASRLLVAVTHADEAEKLPLYDRLGRFSFLSRYTGKIVSPKKIDKSTVMKYYKKFQKMFFINLDEDIDSSDEDDLTITSLKNRELPNSSASDGQPKAKKAKIVDKDMTQATLDSTDDFNAKGRDSTITTDEEAGKLSVTQPDSLETTLDNINDKLNNTTSNNSNVAKTQDSFRKRTASSGSDDFDF